MAQSNPRQGMTRGQKSFLLKVARALGACQLVEFELKFYITQALELCQKRIAGCLPFGITGADYADASLERLIGIYQKLSDCPALIKRLNAFKAERNHLAHRAIVACFNPDGSFEAAKAKPILVRSEKVEQEAVALVEAITAESGKWLGHLYFDPVDEKG